MNVGDEVTYGGFEKSVVKEIFEDGKYYGLECTRIVKTYLEERQEKAYRICPWVDVRPVNGIKNTHLSKNQEFTKLNFYQTPLESLIHRYYYFGIDMNPDYQRDFVWEQEDKDALIDSIFSNVDIGKFAFIHRDFVPGEPDYEIIDGKQRLNTIIEFYENRFPYKGYYFRELSGKDRATSENHHITMGDAQNMSREEILNYFVMLNKGGKPMEQSQLDKVEKMLEKEHKKSKGSERQ